MNDIIEIEHAEVTGPRAEFEAAHPEAREIRIAAQKKIGELMGDLRTKVMPIVMDFAKDMWQIGKQVEAFADTLPGKELTPDFYEQMQAGFVDKYGHPISHWALMTSLRMARRYPDGEITSFDVQEHWKQLPMFSGVDGFAPPVEKPGEKAKKKDSNPYMWIQGLNDRCVSDVESLRRNIDSFRHNPAFGDLSTLKSRDRQLHYEVSQLFKSALKARQTECDVLREGLGELGE